MDKKKYDTTICFIFKDKNRIKLKGCKNTHHTNCNQNRAGVAILISDKMYFETNIVTGDKEEYPMTKGLIH